MGQWDPATLDRFGSMYPTVLLGGHTRRANVDSIWVDSSHGIDLAVSYLVEAGHRSLVLINGPLDTPTSWEKKAGFERAVSMAPEPVRGSVFGCVSFSESAARNATLTMLATVPDATAVIIAETLIAQAVYDVLVEQGRAVPDDVSLIVFRDDPQLLTTDPPMTAIGFSSLDIARETLTHLVKRINDPAAKGKRILFKPFIIERGSVARMGANASA